jgi:hypothetical protein
VNLKFGNGDDSLSLFSLGGGTPAIRSGFVDGGSITGNTFNNGGGILAFEFTLQNLTLVNF